ncbi:acyl-CoA dehydrogenase family protein [Roseibium sp.]|uniref:acyl-CoA dehydrogenase family protein n=1 Tax=Roseibium sp. TaxID=1936156 RepID=UPI003A971F4A
MFHKLPDELHLISETAGKLSRDHLEPLAATLDSGEGRESFLKNLNLLAANGFMGLNISSDYGGTEAGATGFALAIAKLAEGCAATALTVSVSNMVAEVIQAVGSQAQRDAYLPKLTDGTFPAGGFCLTEADAGSDAASMRCRAAKDGDFYVLNGSKLYISSAEYAGLFVVWAVTDPAARKGKGISCFLVEANTPGLIIGKAEKKMGQTGSATNEVHFQDCRIPASALMGEENEGFRIAVKELAGGRIGIAALAYGIGVKAMETAKVYVSERKQFGQPLSAQQGIQWMLADRETELEAARLLVLQAAALKDDGLPFAKQASMAKLYASETAQRATYTALQLHGGAGYLREYPLERYARDARITTIYEGTSEIQRLVIAREILKDF